MNKKTKSFYLRILKFNTARKYFGEFTGNDLNMAYKIFKHTQDWNKPMVNAQVRVGYIDGPMICRVLWNEMSYNPVRFGTTSPFLYNGQEKIFRFWQKNLTPDMPGYEALVKVQQHLNDFLMFNRLPNGQYYDVVNPKYGILITQFVDGHSDNNYKKMAALREALKVITEQNEKDFEDEKYRNEMFRVISERHPNGIRSNTFVINTIPKDVPTPRPLTPEEAAEDRLDKAEENARITADTYKYRPSKDYKQALSDLKTFRDMRNNQKEK